MNGHHQEIHTVVTELTDEHKRGFKFLYGGKECFCFAGEERAAEFAVIKVGDRVSIMGRWSTAIVDVFEGERVTIHANIAG